MVIYLDIHLKHLLKFYACIETHSCFSSWIFILILFSLDTDNLCQNTAAISLNRPFGNRNEARENMSETKPHWKPDVEWKENTQEMGGYLFITRSFAF